MSNYNRVILMGNLTRDPDVRTLMGGGKVAKLGLAVNRRWRDKQGALQEEATFVDIDFFGQSADTLQRYGRKGGSLLVEGRLALDTWHDKVTGEPRQRLKVLGERFQFGHRSTTSDDEAPGISPPGGISSPQTPADDNIPY